ncbi:hypothetical protein F8S13_20965 [Chloroflexia bacterium SDU3-3]|nr:hypothetical protein F8S13_20965 [Chloroflexia bacterium SDU3-3]
MKRFFLVLMAAALGTPAPAQPAQTTPQQRILTSQLVGHPAVTDAGIFFLERRGDQYAAARYRAGAGSQTLALSPAPLESLAADAATAVWAEANGEQRRLVGYDIASGRTWQVATLAGRADLAVDGDTLYIADADGLRARSLADGGEVLVSASGRRPVAAGGALLWSEEQPGDPGQRSVWRLVLRAVGRDAELARGAAGYGGFVSYALVGGGALWAFAPGGPQGVFRYALASGATERLAEAQPDSLALWGGAAAWVRAEGDGWLIERGGVAAALPVRLAVEGGYGGELLASWEEAGAHTLALGDEAALGARAATRAAPSAACASADPRACGQVRASGGALADGVGPWAMRGVQFFLPAYGINDKTFYDGNYAAAVADGSLDFWLDRAQSGLRANALRIFISLPYRSDGATVTPTSHQTLYDFAQRAASRGMRLGISIHNSADWAMTPERAAWLAGLLDYFAARSALPLIAYLNSDNEINNHCGDGRDCFDNFSGHEARPYIDGAVGWTAQVAAIARARGVLVVAGISSEVQDFDGTRAAFDYFRPASDGRSLAALVDALAPHNYSGGAAGVIDDLRYNGYQGPVLLEEYGFPTDPQPQDPAWTEGPPSCRLAPLAAGCQGTAPYFVEVNLQAMRTRSYSGGAAWMLADMDERNSGSACAKKPFALWTGLFTTSGTYCAGTATRGLGTPKATGVRVCLFYGGELFACDTTLELRTRMYLPIVGR